MDLSIEKIINQKLCDTFTKLGLDTAYAAVKVSDRPDLSDFQCNGALALAKQEKKNPREIAARIAGELEKDADFAKISIDGPGFINLTLKDEAIAAVLDQIAADGRFGAVSEAQNGRGRRFPSLLFRFKGVFFRFFSEKGSGFWRFP